MVKWLRVPIILILTLWIAEANAVSIPQSLSECSALCNQYFPGGPVVTPVDPPPVIPPVVTKVFPHEITFERATDQGNGSAGILFRTLPTGSVVYVSVNGEVARLGTPYKGSPVFLLTKAGDEYPRPLVFIIKMSDGQTYMATSGTAPAPGTPTPGTPPPTGQYKNSKSFSSYGVRNGRQAWRIPMRGDSLGSGPVKFVFSSGAVFTVPSTAKNCRDQESTCSRNSKAEDYGFVFKPGNGKPNGEGDSDIGTAHGGIYLHSPFGDDSQSVIMYW